MGFRPSVCIYVIDTNCLPEGERIGYALCGYSYGFWRGVVLDVRANGAASGLKQGGGSARRAVSASGLSAGTNTISLRNPHRMLRTDLAVAALAVMHRTATPGP